MFYLFIGIGLFIRLLLIPVAGFKADVAFWKGWGLAVADKGILWLVNNTNYNYPPGFAYILWLINKVYALFKNPYLIGEYWADNNVFYLFLIKLITIIADLVVVWIIIQFGKIILGHVRETRELKTDGLSGNLVKILVLFYYLNPAVIYDGVVWGQVDQLGLALFLSGCYLLFIGKPKFASVVFVISCLMKFQNIIFIPLFFLYIFKKFSFKELIWSLTTACLTFLIVVSPFVIGRQMEKLIWLLTINSDWFPWFSLNSFNIWWLLSGLKGMQMNDKHLFLGIISAKQFSLYLFIFTYFIGSLSLLFSKKETLFRNFILASSLAVFSFFHLLTQSHERYLFPVMGFFPLLIIYSVISNYKAQMSNQIQSPNSKLEAQKSFGFWNLKLISNLDFVIWILVSFFFFLNMYISMGWNYPDQVVPKFTREQTLGLSWWISVIQIILFAAFVIRYFKDFLIKNVRPVSLFAGLLIAWLILKNTNYLLKKPVSLTLLKPVGYRQDYLEPVYNKTVESARGVHFWNRLSVNYFYYDKGIGSHADSEITYHLAGKFSSFSTDYGIDTEGDQSAKVYFSILGDGKELFKSNLKGRFDKPDTITVNVRSVKYLTLKITKAGESNFGAHADWLKPELIK